MNSVYVVTDFRRAPYIAPAVSVFSDRDAAYLYYYYLSTSDKSIQEVEVLDAVKLSNTRRMKAGNPL